MELRMPSQSEIVSALRSASGPICDDCLCQLTSYSCRQGARGAALSLAAKGVLQRAESRCSICGGLKTTSLGVVANDTQSAVDMRVPVSSTPVVLTGAGSSNTGGAHRPWHWEGNIQSVLVAHLAGQGYRITQVVDTASKQAGVDIRAERDDQELWVTVKGYPEQKSRTHPATQARHWFSGAIFDLVLYRSERSDVMVAMGMPDGFVTYQNLAARVGWLKKELPFRVLWVTKEGGVRED